MVTVRSTRAKAGNEPITILTVYDVPVVGVVDEAGTDTVPVGDRMGNMILGYDSTLSVTVENVANRTATVAHATDGALAVADMPFLSVGMDGASSVEHCGRMLKEVDADAVKLEYDPHTAELTEHLIRLGALMMAHLGLTPQRIKEAGYGRQGTDRDDAQEVLDLAKTHAEVSTFSLVLEYVLASPVKQVTEAIDIPTVGIGADPDCNGQVFVVDDVVGMSGRTPPFVTQFGDVKSEMEKTIGAYRDVVEAGEFSAGEHNHVENDPDELY